MAQWKDIGNPDATTTDSLHGKIGTDTEMADSSLFDILAGAAGIASFPAAATAASGVSLAEVIRHIEQTLIGGIDDATTDTLHGKLGTDTELADNSLYDLLGADAKTDAIAAVLSGAGCIVTFPAVAAPASNVSLAEVIRAIYDRQLGDGTNAAQNCLLGKRIQRAKADIVDSSTTAVLVVATGEILLTGLFAKINDANHAAGAANLRFQMNPTTGSTTNLCANLDVDADEVGTLYSVNGAVATALVVSSSGAVPAMATPMVLPPGNIEIVSNVDAGSGGATLELWAYYFPLDDGATLATA